MLNRELNTHSWKAFTRNPMFERNLAVRIFMYVIFGFLALELLALSFVFDVILLKVGPYDLAIHTFNSCVLFFFLGDFVMKFLMKKSRSMQVVPYLSLPIPHNKLFNFILYKEFYSVWNWYPLFLVLPFALKAITPYFGVGAALLYILAFFLFCVCNSLLVNIVNNLINRSGWMFFLPIALIAAIVGIGFIPGVNYLTAGVLVGEFMLNSPLLMICTGAILTFVLWIINQKQMRQQLYREMDSSGKKEKISTHDFSFFAGMGEIGRFMNLEIKMTLRSKRLKQSLYVSIGFLIYYFAMMYLLPGNILSSSPFMSIFFTMFVIGMMGLIMTQWLFTSESSFFDGLMARDKSLLPMLKGKYLLYSAYAFVTAMILMIAVFQEKLSFFYLVSVFFYVIGPTYFLMFQNAVYNKSYFDLFQGGAFNMGGTSSNMLVVTMLGMFLPVVIILIIAGVFGQTVANYTMLISGILFTVTYNQWLAWTYKRFLKRKYKNMEGFRAS